MASRFVFAFDNPSFSDRVLLLVREPGAKQQQDQKRSIAALDEDVLDNTTLRRLHVNAMLLASESRFFRALLSNGMKETEQKEIRLVVADENEASRVCALLKLLYTNEIDMPESKRTSATDLLALLLQADKLGIDSAIVRVSDLLCKCMTVETAAAFLDLPESIISTDSYRAVLKCCTDLLVEQFQVTTRVCSA